MVNKLYPPIISGTLPAFVGQEITIPFQMNRAVSMIEVSGLCYIIKTVSSNVVIAQGTTADFTPSKVRGCLEQGSITFSINLKSITNNGKPIQYKLNPGQSYKIQLAYINTNKVVGYYSTVGIAKCTTKPAVYIKGFEDNLVGINKTDFIGVYSQKEKNDDITEKVYSYRFKVYDENNNIFADSGEQLHNSINDIELNESYDSFELNKELQKNKNYFIQYSITTINNYEAESVRYQIINRETINPELQATLSAVMDENNGYVKINLNGIRDKKTGLEIPATGAFALLRASSEDNFNTWNTVLKFKLVGETPSRELYRDFTVEHGFSYQYAVQQYSDETVVRSNKIFSNTVYSIFEDSFLYSNGQLLKIRFNPKVSSFKINTLESKTDTIGSQYPYIFRNGNTYYHEFPVSGLISYLMDEDHLFMDKLGDDEIKDFISTDLTDYNINIERQFKTKALEFLTDGEPKLFKSPTEGNFIVRLLNVSLSPEDKLGRMLHTFSGTAYEIDKVSFDNLTTYGFIDADPPESEILKWDSISFDGWYKINGYIDDVNTYIDNLKDENLTQTEINKLQTNKQTCLDNLLQTLSFYPMFELLYDGNHYSLQTKDILANSPAITIRFEGFAPGDKFSIDGEEIVIGITGAYLIDHVAPIYSVKVVELSDAGLQQGTIVYSYYGKQASKFDTINDIQVADLPLEQYYGTEGNILNLYNDDFKYKVTQIYFLRFTKRDVQKLYTSNKVNFYTTPGGAISEEEGEKDHSVEIKRVDFDPTLIYHIYLVSQTEEQDYYIDGYTKKEIYDSGVLVGEKNWACNIRINEDDKQIIGIDQKNEYQIKDLTDITSIEIDPGVLCELSVQRQEVVYSFENDNQTTYRIFNGQNYITTTIYQLKQNWLRAKKALKDFKELEQDKSNPDFTKDDPFYNVNQNNIQTCIKNYNNKVARLQKTVDETYTLFIDTLRKAVEDYEDSKTI